MLPSIFLVVFVFLHGKTLFLTGFFLGMANLRYISIVNELAEFVKEKKNVQ